ncbi:MAG: sulfotransferase family 2 domain-containing protein [Opitutales bacterium]|nr:sulfotransferase family 2 domain-containing protein [Opitutales bacterium]
MHIPKCAGTALIAALKAGLGGVACRSMDHRRTFRALRAQRSEWETDAWMLQWIGHRQALFYAWLSEKVPFVYGHMPVSARTLDAHGAGYRFFTVLRDPVERFISNYVYDKTGPGERIPDVLPTGKANPRAELECFLETPEARWMALEQVLMLAGLDDCGGFEPEDAAQRAVANLEKFSLIGFTHDMKAFERRFAETFGVSIAMESRNTTADWIRKKDARADYYSAFDDTVRARVNALCACEYRVYEEALRCYAGADGGGK